MATRPSVPILEATTRPPPARFSHSSSGSGNGSGNGSGRRFAMATAPSLRPSYTQDSDPCLLAAMDSWSDDDDDTKTHDRHATRPTVQRSHTEKASGAHGGLLTPPVAPLTIRVRKFASTSALDTKAPATIDTADASSLPPPPPLADAIDREVATTITALEDGTVERVPEDKLLQSGRTIIPLTQRGLPNAGGSARSVMTPPPTNQRHFLLRWTRNPRFRRWYGRILNSYFAFWLVVCSLVVAMLEMVLLLTIVMLHNNRIVRDHLEKDRSCHTLTRGRFGPLHYLGAAACVTLVLPVLFPINIFSLYHKREDRRMIRRPYLHLCELFVTIEVGYLVYFLIAEGTRLPVTIKCQKHYQPSETTFLYVSLLLWCVLWWQLIVFCRFLVHLKLQADAANDATHTSALSDWLSGDTSRRELTASKGGRPIQRFKKLLYRAAARGTTDEVNQLLEEKSLEQYGIASAQDVPRLYKCPTLWLYAFAESCKNPLHVAARRGHVAIVDRFLSLGFDANALDKVARVNFNLGLLFKIATRMLLKTQDGSTSPLRPLLCSVLLPPLHGAVAAGHVDVVRLLLEKGNADPDLLPRASFYHPSAVIPAIFLADDPEIVKLLVARGANFLHVATTTLSGLASSTYATALQRSALTQRTATTEYLLSCGADVALTPLHAAAAADNARTVRRLLRRRPRQDANVRDSVDARGERVEGVQRRTPLHWAAVVGRASAATTLLNRGADPNARDRYGRTPLHWAARNNHRAVVELLLEHGADATIEDDSGVPVLSFAAEAEGVEPRVFAALLEHGASLKHQLLGSGDTPLHIALQRENRETAKSLIRCGADLMASNNDGKRAVDVTTSTKLQFELKKEAGTRDVMISYPHSHFAFAQRIREYLETHGKLTCWMDTMDPSGIGGGAVWREEIARGIHNCSLVVSIVCGGYTTSEWCLKELALAKMIRKPVVALMVEPPSNTVDEDYMGNETTALDGLVPLDRRVPFHDFVRGTSVQDKSVELDVDEAAFEAAWRDVLPQLKNAMQTPDSPNSRWLKSASTMSSTGGRRVYTHGDAELDGENDEEHSRDDDRDEERKTDSLRESDELSLLGSNAVLSVAVYSTIKNSVLSERLVRDLQGEGFGARKFGISAEATDAQLVQQLFPYRVLVVVIESLGFEASRDQRQNASVQLTQVLRVAATVGIHVFPIVARDEFLSFSNLYTLARSELLYFVSGAGEKQSTNALLRQLRRAADRGE